MYSEKYKTHINKISVTLLTFNLYILITIKIFYKLPYFMVKIFHLDNKRYEN